MTQRHKRTAIRKRSPRTTCAKVIAAKPRGTPESANQEQFDLTLQLVGLGWSLTEYSQFAYREPKLIMPRVSLFCLA